MYGSISFCERLKRWLIVGADSEGSRSFSNFKLSSWFFTSSEYFSIEDMRTEVCSLLLVIFCTYFLTFSCHFILYSFSTSFTSCCSNSTSIIFTLLLSISYKSELSAIIIKGTTRSLVSFACIYMISFSMERWSDGLKLYMILR